MKKLIAIIFALATILALTIIPASATYDQYNLPMDPSGKKWVDITNSSGKHLLYVYVEMNANDVPEGALIDAVLSNRDSEFVTGPVLDLLGESLGLYINDSVQFQVMDSSRKTLLKDATFYVEILNKNYFSYAVDTIALTQKIREEGQGGTYADVTTRITDKVKLKSPDGKTREYYKVSQDNAYFTVLSSPDRVDFPISPAATNFSSSEFQHNTTGSYGGAIYGSTFMNSPTWFIISIAEFVAVVALSVVLVTKNKKEK